MAIVEFLPDFGITAIGVIVALVSAFSFFKYQRIIESSDFLEKNYFGNEECILGGTFFIKLQSKYIYGLGVVDKGERKRLLKMMESYREWRYHQTEVLLNYHALKKDVENSGLPIALSVGEFYSFLGKRRELVENIVFGYLHSYFTATVVRNSLKDDYVKHYLLLNWARKRVDLNKYKSFLDFENDELIRALFAFVECEGEHGVESAFLLSRENINLYTKKVHQTREVLANLGRLESKFKSHIEIALLLVVYYLFFSIYLPLTYSENIGLFSNLTDFDLLFISFIPPAIFIIQYFANKVFIDFKK